jgi:2-phosphoglycerate kinase
VHPEESHPSGLLVVSGPPGAGKSTVAAIIAERFPRSVVVEADRFFNFMASGRIDPWLKEANEQNGVVLEAAAVATAAYVRHGYATVYDGVLGPWFVPLFLAATGLPALHYSVLLPDADLCEERVTGRDAHHFRDGPATRMMHKQFARTEIEPRHVVDTNGSPADVAAEILARFDRGELVVRAG